MNCIKKLFVFKFLFLLVLLTSCYQSEENKSSNNTNPYCEIIGKDIIIKDKYKVYSINNFIYDNLVGKSGSYTVYAIRTKTDYYGNRTESKHRVGSINADELNKFENFNFWHIRTGGIEKMLSEFNSLEYDSLGKEYDLN